MPSPKRFARIGDHSQLIEASDGDLTARPVDQLVVRAADGEDRHILLFEKMRPQQLRERVRALGISDFSIGWLNCDESKLQALISLVKQAYPNKLIEERPATPAGVHKVDGRIEFRFNAGYFRAIAKIAFHYYLTRNKRGFLGSEPHFDAIRRFIMGEGDATQFFHSSGRTFVLPFGPITGRRALLPTRWCHILAADERQGAVVTYVHLFAGPKAVRRPHHLTLGHTRSPLVLPGGVWAHVFEYDYPQSDSGYAGAVQEALISRLR